MHLSHFAYPFIHRHLGCFHLLAIVNNAAMNIDVHKPLQGPAFKGFQMYTRIELMDHIIILFLTFRGASILFPAVATPFNTPHSAQGLDFTTSSLTLVIFFFYVIAILMRLW